MKKSILIVDDDQITRKMLAGLVKKQGHEAIELASAVGILEFVQTNDIQLVLLDIMMPEVCGIDALKTLREYYSSLSLPIIMVSSKSESSEVVQAFEFGASDYITKPVNQVVLQARLKTQLMLRKMHDLEIKNKEIDSINSMIATYNHEINNPLTVAIGNLSLYKRKGGEKRLLQLDESLKLIAEIIRKIKDISKSIETQDYGKDTKTYKIKKERE